MLEVAFGSCQRGADGRIGHQPSCLAIQAFEAQSVKGYTCRDFCHWEQPSQRWLYRWLLSVAAQWTQKPYPKP